MRRVIARLLVFAVFLSTFQGVGSVQAAVVKAAYGFDVTSQILIEQNNGLQLSNRIKGTEETAVAKWDVSATGKYQLVYYIEARSADGKGNETKKIVLEFDNTDRTNLDFKASTYTVTAEPALSIVQDKIDYTTRELNNTTNMWENGISKKDVDFVEKKLILGNQVARENREFNFSINTVSILKDDQKTANLEIKLKLNGDQMIVYTNGISKGNITNFELRWGTSNAVQAEEEIFNGPRNFTITPVHLDQNGLTSTDIIMDSQAVKPGSKPGIKVSFDKIKNLQGGVFKPIVASNKKVTLLLGPEYNLDSMAEGIRLDFIPTVGATVEVDMGKESYSNAVMDAGDQLSLYLTKDKVASAPEVITWSVLDPSMIVGSAFVYNGTDERYRPVNKGHTYLHYNINKTNGNQVQFNILPYSINTKATYSIYSGVNADSEFSKADMVYEYDPDKTTNKEITAIVPSKSGNYFKIEVKIDNNLFYSQVVYYDPTKFPAVPEVTQIKTIDNVYVVPSDDAVNPNAQPQAIGFDLEWRAPSNLLTLLKEGKLYYELLLRKDKNDLDPLLKTSTSTSDDYATYSKMFEISLVDGQVVVRPAVGTAGETYDTPLEEVAAAKARYNISRQTFSMEKVSLKNFTKTDAWEQIIVKDNHLATTGKGYLEDAYAEDSLLNRMVPGTYYLSLRTVFISNDETKNIVYSAESNMEAITLDNTKEIIPVPNKITTEDITVNDKVSLSEKITFNYVDIRNYVNKMMTPAQIYLYTDENIRRDKYNGEYEIYLYQKKDKLSETIDAVTKGKTQLREINERGTEIDNLKLDLTQLIDGKADIDRLREGETIPINIKIDALQGTGTGEFDIVGLDPNQVYYLQIRVKLSPWQEIFANKLPKRYSLFSKEVTFTTSTEPLPPSPEDKVPPTPEEIWIIDQPNNTSVTLGWSPADFEADDDIENTYYEFVRTEHKLTDDEGKKTVEELVNTDGKKVGFRSDAPENQSQAAFMSTYLNSKKAWEKLEPEQPSDKFNLTDDTLQPNSVYYYYIRTVCIIDGRAVKSSWIMIPVTTAPVDAPINLKVELAKNYAHNTKTEIVISFDAPIPDGADVPKDYDFDIAIQGELDEAYTLTKYSTVMLTSKEDESLTPKGYRHYVYKITGLKPNKRYDIKVRVKDKTKPLLAGGSYPTSLYCPKVTTRTEYDEDEADKDDRFEEYLKKYDAEAEKLRRRAYWVVDDGVYKYRESYINTDLGLKPQYELVGDEDQNLLYYYMPASTFYAASEKNTTLQITLQGQTLHIRPYTLSEETEEIKEALSLVKSDKIEDYYVGIEFALYKATTTAISGETVLTPQIVVDMEVVQMKQSDMLMEEDIMIALNELIATERLEVIKELEKKIYNGTIADDVLENIIQSALGEVKKEHPAKVKKLMTRYKGKIDEIMTIDKSLLITSVLDVASINGYYLDTKWTSVPTYQVANGFAIEAAQLGIYIFTGQKSLINIMPSLGPYQSFISKYNLTDFFVLNTYSIKAAATKEQVYGMTARVMGAARGTDYINFLKLNSMKGISSVGKTNKIRQDETIYIVMQAYEKLYNRPVSSVVIRNKQSVQNIGAFQTIYRNYVYAGVELKIINNPNAKVLPSKEMSVEEIIQILYKVQAK